MGIQHANNEMMQTVKVMTAPQLLKLEAFSRQMGFNQNLSPKWLEEIIDFKSSHFLFPELVHGSAGGQKVDPHIRSILRFKIKPQKNWKNGLFLVSLLDLPFNLVEDLEGINREQAIWLCRHMAICGPSVAEFENFNQNI